jgi:plastocyanin
MQRQMQGRLAMAAGAIALVLAGCGGGEGGATGTQPPPPQTTKAPGAAATGGPVTIGETEFKLTPANPQVKAGTVQFKAVNRGGVVHALEVEGPSGEVETRELQPGQTQTISVKLDKPGRYEMYCPVGNHKEQGMEGTVVVS